MKINTLLSLLIVAIATTLQAQEKTEFPSKDGLTITADLYEQGNNERFILLFHQAGWSRGEYRETAPKLNKLGYSCLALDQRSGGEVNGVVNETSARAKKAGKGTGYLDAFQDIEAAVNYIRKKYAPKQLIIWGSSYSSSLVLKYAGDYPENIDAVLSFSPGEYFGKQNFIKKSAANIKAPAFITSAKSEKGSWWAIYQAIPGAEKQYFLPNSGGKHGSRALWNKFDNSDDYWVAVKSFLQGVN